ncbi:MAG: electron transfer flavoprotein subunit beta/FixA family protein [candidate division Zixibacteria bacterium]|nr:electron transfer flavoprotein subunit beta/FixA family protein [candidate division Zixibacteria bacterium]
MNIAVCIKQVPDTETKIVLNPDSTDIVTEGIKLVMNPYDEYAVEEALKIKEKYGGKVTILCLGPEKSIEAIRTALAMGADDAVLLNDPAFEGGDSFTTALVLSKALSQIEYDIILTGKQAVDLDCSQVYAGLAEFLNLPYVSVVVGLELFPDQKKALAKRETEGGEKELIEVSLPAVFACQKDLNTPRYASLPGIMKAKKKEIKKLGLAEFCLNLEHVGAKGSKLKKGKYSLPPQRKAGIKIEGEIPEAAAKLVKLLREEAKII